MRFIPKDNEGSLSKVVPPTIKTEFCILHITRYFFWKLERWKFEEQLFKINNNESLFSVFQMMVVPVMAAPHRLTTTNTISEVKSVSRWLIVWLHFFYDHNNMWLTRLINYFCQGPPRSVLIPRNTGLFQYQFVFESDYHSKSSTEPILNFKRSWNCYLIWSN